MKNVERENFLKALQKSPVWERFVHFRKTALSLYGHQFKDINDFNEWYNGLSSDCYMIADFIEWLDMERVHLIVFVTGGFISEKKWYCAIEYYKHEMVWCKTRMEAYKQAIPKAFKILEKREPLPKD